MTWELHFTTASKPIGFVYDYDNIYLLEDKSGSSIYVCIYLLLLFNFSEFFMYNFGLFSPILDFLCILSLLLCKVPERGDLQVYTGHEG